MESEANLYTPPGDAGDWYEYLSERLNPSFDEFEHNKLSIVTFNYDRSLEHYLFTSLRKWHRRSVDDCIEKFAKLPIIHVYGQLGKIPYPQRGCRQYLPFGEDEKKVPGAWLSEEAKRKRVGVADVIYEALESFVAKCEAEAELEKKIIKFRRR